MASTASPTEQPWHAAFPQPRNQSPNGISREDLLSQMKQGAQSGKDFVLVDLRRTDFEGGTIRGSLNMPAQSLYNTLPALYTLCQNAGVKNVIFYCGSSAGRGTRAAGWFDDLLSDRGTTDIQSLILVGGIKGWARSGTEYTQMMDAYDAQVWKQSTS